MAPTATSVMTDVPPELGEAYQLRDMALYEIDHTGGQLLRG